ncbi:hypothetical protein Rsub_07588 [Raphidocelis subcapitata]|uniref:Cytochrome b561 domain-containing protein n=1 Tax=Raphidocelis subcapitata TaxID=307507 RepID=A0A2V0PC72_9CHLO|nr:hypothetical protein Rsub_07588 [Raphidocelis subcapitata]|eukprot:GBF94705.1 hypothetical protein Rsub_07588 [Raphidocelis subcapitata]
MPRRVLLLVGLAACVLQAAAFPSLFLAKNAKNCFDHPTKAFGGHGAPIADKDAKFAFTELNGAPVKAVCPGGKYAVTVFFPGARLVLLTSSAGNIGGDAKCPNSIHSGDKSPSNGFVANVTVPCDAAGKPLAFRVTSATGPKDTYRQAGAELPVGFTNGACANISASAKCPPVLPPTGAMPPPLTVGFRPLGMMPQAKRSEAGDKVLMLPVIPGSDRATWAYLHGALMMTAFALLLPMGALIGRHRWMFGRDPRTGKVFDSWIWVHVIIQALALVCALAGFAIVLLGTGFKTMNSVWMYEPHKWLGIATIGSALLQFAVAPLRLTSKAGSRARGAWTGFHHLWGRLTVAAGIANVFLGTVVVHNYHGQPFAYWVAPAAACLGLITFVAAVLEATKLQLQRTHRYSRKDDSITPIYEIKHNSKKRAGGDGDAGADGASANGAANGVHSGAEAGAGAGAAALPIGVPPPAPAANGGASYPRVNYSGGASGNFAGGIEG